MESLGTAFKATRLVLEENPTGSRTEAKRNPSGSKEQSRALNSVLKVLKTNSRPGDRQTPFRTQPGRSTLADKTTNVPSSLYGTFMLFSSSPLVVALLWRTFIRTWLGRRSTPSFTPFTFTPSLSHQKEIIELTYLPSRSSITIMRQLLDMRS
jgi:hypothetical protein